jgi:hypothetical protein
MSYDIFLNKLLFLKYQVIPSILHSTNNVKHKTPQHIFQTYNVYPAKKTLSLTLKLLTAYGII